MRPITIVYMRTPIPDPDRDLPDEEPDQDRWGPFDPGEPMREEDYL
jgi:hypothetical protein